MQKVGLLTREKIINDLKTRLTDSRGYFFINFNKVSAFAFNRLRNNLKDSNARVFVTKNSLFEKVFKGLGCQGVEEFIGSETGVVLVYDEDVVKTCKVLADFAKENETLQLKGGFIDERKISSKEMSVLAKLPSREILLGSAVSALAAPLTGFLSVLNQTVLKFVWAVEEIKKKKEKS